MKTTEEFSKWPNWAMYKATDLDGRGYYYEFKPNPRDDTWTTNGRMKQIETEVDNWKDTLVSRPKSALKKIDWSKLHIRAAYYWSTANGIPSPWIPWNVDEETNVRPVPDGLMIEYFAYSRHSYVFPSHAISSDVWMNVNAFRIVGIAEGWEA